MEKNRSMTLKQRNRALGMLEAGMAVTHVARNIGVIHSTISRLRTKFNTTGPLKDQPCTGRFRKTTANEDRYITLTSRRNRFASSQKITDQFYTTPRTIFKQIITCQPSIDFISFWAYAKLLYTTIYPC